MSKLLELSSKLVKAVNDNPSKLLQEIVQRSNQYDNILEKIRILKSRIKEDEASAKIDFLICKLTNSEHFTNKIVKVMKNDQLVAILADNVIKPKIEMHCDTKEVDCKCIMKNQKITFTPQVIKHIDNLSYLDQIKNQPMIIKLYTHSYRSYSGFTCYILILTEKECLLIDTLKIRKVNHEIFKCNTYKYFHCKNCYYQFVQEFCNVGCADIMKGSESVFCDWRIRPYSIHFEEIIQKDILELNEDYKLHVESKAQTQVQNIIEKKINDASLLMFNDLLDTHTDEYDANIYKQQDVNYEHLAEQFMHFYNISIENKNFLVEMIKLRNFIAKSNDESVFYTMTDMQLCKLVCVKPQTKNDFIECLERMSALVREHIFDFLMVIQSCTKNEKFRAEGKESSLIEGSSDLDTESKVNTSMTNGEIANESSTEELLKGVKRK